jgi:hypothetical protein
MRATIYEAASKKGPEFLLVLLKLRLCKQIARQLADE